MWKIGFLRERRSACKERERKKRGYCWHDEEEAFSWERVRFLDMGEDREIMKPETL